MTTLADSQGRSALARDSQVIGLVGAGHAISHFAQLLLVPLFPWLRDAFQVSYTQLGILMTVTSLSSCLVQAGSGFLVDRIGTRSVLFGGMLLIGLASCSFAVSQTYAMLLIGSVVLGVGAGIFHPVDYTLLNHRVSAPRLGYAYSFHGICGMLGFALAPILMVPIAQLYSWRAALLTAGLVTFGVLALMLLNRDKLDFKPARTAAPSSETRAPKENSFAFLRIAAVWSCLGFFFIYAVNAIVMQAFAPEAARQLHTLPLSLSATNLTLYLLANGAGMVMGGYFASRTEHSERIVGICFGLAAALSLVLASAALSPFLVSVLFTLMGLAVGNAGPSRDLLIKRSTPANASGRVYGVVYSGLDIGAGIAPLIFGPLLDQHHYSGVFYGLALVQAILILGALNVRRSRRPALAS